MGPEKPLGSAGLFAKKGNPWVTMKEQDKKYPAQVWDNPDTDYLKCEKGKVFRDKPTMTPVVRKWSPSLLKAQVLLKLKRK